MIHYLHDSILYDTEMNILFYVSEKSKKKIITNNWHKYLNTIGWTKLPLNLIRFLNRNSEKNTRTHLMASLTVVVTASVCFTVYLTHYQVILQTIMIIKIFVEWSQTQSMMKHSRVL